MGILKDSVECKPQAAPTSASGQMVAASPLRLALPSRNRSPSLGVELKIQTVDDLNPALP